MSARFDGTISRAALASQDSRTVEVEEWLHSLPLAPSSKAKLKCALSTLYNHAIRYEWMSASLPPMDAPCSCPATPNLIRNMLYSYINSSSLCPSSLLHESRLHSLPFNPKCSADLCGTSVENKQLPSSLNHLTAKDRLMTRAHKTLQKHRTRAVGPQC